MRSSRPIIAVLSTVLGAREWSCRRQDRDGTTAQRKGIGHCCPACLEDGRRHSVQIIKRRQDSCSPSAVAPPRGHFAKAPGLGKPAATRYAPCKAPSASDSLARRSPCMHARSSEVDSMSPLAHPASAASTADASRYQGRRPGTQIGGKCAVAVVGDYVASKGHGLSCCSLL